MATFNGTILGENLKNFRIAAHLTRTELGDFFNVSDRTIKNIENDSSSTKQETISMLLNFFGYTHEKASQKLIEIPINFREHLQKRHSKNTVYKPVLTKTPSIPFALKFKLIQTGELNSPKTIREIKLFFDDLKWKYTRDAISNAISVNKKELNIESSYIRGDNKTLVYQLRQ